MIEEQQTILSIKNYVSNIRSRIFNDNKAGLTDPAKIFEGIVIVFYNIFFEVDDFKGFKKSNQICIDIISDKAKIAVTIKARDTHQSKTQINEIISKFNINYPDFKEYRLFLQEICDRPKKNEKIDDINLMYFGDLCNLFNDNPEKLIKIKNFIEYKRKFKKTESYLNYIFDYYLNDINIGINNMLGFQTYNLYNYIDLVEPKPTLANFKNNKVFFWSSLLGLWKEIENKEYLKLDISDEAIEILDRLWWIGYSNNKFVPVDPFEIDKNLDELKWYENFSKNGSTVYRLYTYLLRINRVAVDLKNTIR